MAKRDIAFESRMQGMIYAQKIAHEQGIEGLDKEVRMRGITKIPLNITQKEIDDMLQYFSRNLYANLTSVYAYGLHELYGFGGDRIARLMKYIDGMVKNTFDMDYMGEHYIRLEDYAVELNEKYNLGIDVAAIASCQTIVDEEEGSTYHYAKIERIIDDLMDHGYIDASEYLRKKVD